MKRESEVSWKSNINKTFSTFPHTESTGLILQQCPMNHILWNTISFWKSLLFLRLLAISFKSTECVTLNLDTKQLSSSSLSTSQNLWCRLGHQVKRNNCHLRYNLLSYLHFMFHRPVSFVYKISMTSLLLSILRKILCTQCSSLVL